MMTRVIFFAICVCFIMPAEAKEELETWELDNPRIHSRVIDGVQKRFSVRKVERRDGKLFLNGRAVDVKAVDWPTEEVGFVLTERIVKRAVIALKEKGYNVLRPAGASEDAVRWCERVGLLVEHWPEADKIAADEILKPTPVEQPFLVKAVEKGRTDFIHLSHVHRGGGARERPDNTLETFLWCWGNGSALECDCRKTKDGVGIMLHDDSLVRTGRGYPDTLKAKSVSRELTWADIADVDVGSYLSLDYASQRIPQMDAVMCAMSGHPKWLLFVDEKGAGPKAIAESARRFGVLDQVYYTGPSVAKAIEWTRETGGGKTLVWIGGWPWNHSKAERERTETHFRKIRDEIAAAGWSKNVTAISMHTYFDPDYPEPFTPSADFIRSYAAEMKAHGIHVYSIPFGGGETEEVYHRLFALGCDGFSTDYPSVMFKVIRDLRAMETAVPQEHTTEKSFTLASFNVRAAGACDLPPNSWTERAPRIAEVVNDRGYDIVGLQEAERRWCVRLMELLPGWKYVYQGREKDGEGESASLMWDDKRFALQESDTFWLSETPEVRGSESWGTACPRTCTWGRLRDRKTGKEFYLFNTHLDCGPNAARTGGMKLILERIRAVRAQTGLPVFLTGDMNTALTHRRHALGPDHPIIMAHSLMKNSWDKSETPHTGPISSWAGFTSPLGENGKPDGQIDHIFVTDDIRVLRSATVNDYPQGLRPSDHHSICCEAEL